MNKPYNIHFILYSLLFLITCGFTTQALAQAPEMSPQFIKVGQKRISRTVYELTFKTTLINHDTPIKNVTATVTSTSPHTIIMSDNTVSFNDLAANETATSVDTFTLRQDMKFPYNPDDIHWDISYEPDVPPISADVHVNITKKRNGGKYIIGQYKNHLTHIHFRSSEGNRPFTLKVSQSIEPAIGLTLTPILDATEYTYSKSVMDKHEQVVKATKPGTYKVTTTATIIETGDSSTRSYIYEVLPSGTPNLSIPPVDVEFQTHGHPMVLRPGTITPVAFGMGSPTGPDRDKITDIRVIIPELNLDIPLNDEGIGNDDKAGDLIYGSEFVDIDTSTLTVGQCLNYYAIASTQNGEVKSKPGLKLCVSNLPAMPYPVKKQDWVKELFGSRMFVRHLISVHFKENVSETRKIEIAESIGGDIVGGMPFTNDYTIRLRNTPSSTEARSVLRQKIQQLYTFPEVLRAGLVIGGSILGSYTDDSIYQSTSIGHILGSNPIPAVTLARADEAWYVTQGKARIAVIDTGVDKQHEDLSGKVIDAEGFNWAELNFDTDDLHHHGSHVAGIAAANSNNGIGIAGVSWGSEILPIKIYPNDEGSGANIDAMVSAIYHAAGNQSTKIINFSTGFETGNNVSLQCLLDALSSQLQGLNEAPLSCINDNLEEIDAMIKICNAVSYATAHNKIFIAAAGNTEGTTLIYPAACPDAVAVAAIEADASGNLKKWQSPVPGLGSRSGNWIDLAAPGYQVISTVPPLTCLKDFLTPHIFLVADACYDLIGGYRRISGTSEAAPFVTGALAMVMARNSELNMAQVLDRIIDSSTSLINESLGDGALNVFDAIFNGNFELNDEDNPIRLAEWEHKETSDAFLHCKAVSFFGNITPPKGKKMLKCGTQGVYEFNTSIPSAGSSVKNRINLPEGVTHLPLSFKWKIASVDLSLSRQTVPWDDRITLRLKRVDDPTKEVILFDTSLNRIMNNGRHLSASSIYPFVETDWTLYSYAYPIPYGAGEYELIIGVADRYDNVGDTYLFVDDLQFRLR